MKPSFHKVPIRSGNSFSIRWDLKPHFECIWHFHPEMELHYIIKGAGVQFIGDNVTNFADGDLIFLGQNLPHTWRCKEDFFQNDPKLNVEAIVLHFLPQCLGKGFLSIPETVLIKHFFESSKRGFLIKEPAKSTIVSLLYKTLKAEGIDKIILIISILKELIYANKTSISDFYTNYPKSDSKIALFDTIYSFTLKNYNREISLEEIAGIANMSISSFCRTFKLITKKTFLDFLIEVRVSNACRLLIDDDFNIDAIAFKTGFNNLSNFYRQFKRIKNSTPLQYKKEYFANLRSLEQ